MYKISSTIRTFTAFNEDGCPARVRNGCVVSKCHDINYKGDNLEISIEGIPFLFSLDSLVLPIYTDIHTIYVHGHIYTDIYTRIYIQYTWIHIHGYNADYTDIYTVYTDRDIYTI